MDSEKKAIFQDDGIDLKELWFSFYNFKELIIIVSILFGIFAYIYSLSIAPTYQASALVVPADQDQNASNTGAGLGGLAALAGIQIENTDPVRTQIAIFKSRIPKSRAKLLPEPAGTKHRGTFTLSNLFIKPLTAS